MLRMVSYPHRPQSGHIMCYLNRTYHVLPTKCANSLDRQSRRQYHLGDSAQIFAHYIPSRAVPPHRICLRQAPTTYSRVEDTMKERILFAFVLLLFPILTPQVYPFSAWEP